MTRLALAALAAATLAFSCGAPQAAAPPDVTADRDDLAHDDAPSPDVADILPAPRTFRVVTFNTGSAPEMDHDGPPDDGYGAAEAALTAAHYGNGLAWLPFVEQTTAFFTALQADVVVFQEIFHPGECPDVPEEARAGFVCQDWAPGAPTVAQRLVGEGFQVACHPGKPDKCAAVRRSVGTFRGCQGDLCLDGLDGFTVPGCGSGARVARGRVDLVSGGTLTVVNVHGTSGFSADDLDCRVAQVEQIFVDLGDGAPAIGPDELGVVLGDLNTDPGRLAEGDPSAARWLDFAGPGRPFAFLSPFGPEAPPSYVLFNIDHVLSATLTGPCFVPGVTEGHPPVLDAALFFDHHPIVCDLTE